MSSRFLSILTLTLCFFLALVVWSETHTTRAGGQSIVVLCSSCTYSGLPEEGHLVLMDANTGEIWAYADAALEGRAAPIRWGRLTLGQAVDRTVK